MRRIPIISQIPWQGKSLIRENGYITRSVYFRGNITYNWHSDKIIGNVTYQISNCDIELNINYRISTELIWDWGTREIMKRDDWIIVNWEILVPQIVITNGPWNSIIPSY